MDYARNVFINCPFDDGYRVVFNTVVFAIYGCGFIPRCALEIDDSGDVRIEKIKRLILESKFGIHDISCTELSEDQLPRFNMPFELGVFIGAKQFGSKKQKEKRTLILDREPYRYQKFISDIAGQDVKSHDDKPPKAIRCIRDWLNAASGRKTIPGESEINRHYAVFNSKLPEICRTYSLDPEALTYNDYSNFVSGWFESVYGGGR